MAKQSVHRGHNNGNKIFAVSYPPWAPADPLGRVSPPEQAITPQLSRCRPPPCTPCICFCLGGPCHCSENTSVPIRMLLPILLICHTKDRARMASTQKERDHPSHSRVPCGSTQPHWCAHATHRKSAPKPQPGPSAENKREQGTRLTCHSPQTISFSSQSPIK